MLHRDRIAIQKIISEINIGNDMLGSLDMEEFLKDEVLKRALSMTTINIGELVKIVSFELREKYPEVPWKAIAGMRDIAAHRYQTLRMEDVYHTMKKDFPKIELQLKEILETEEEDARCPIRR